MNFFDSVVSAFRNFFNFSGRASRSEFWWFFLFCILLYLLAISIAYEDLVTTLDYWFQHDSERENYFDHLISEQSNPTSAILFDNISQKIIQNVEDAEKVVEDSKSVPKQNTS